MVKQYMISVYAVLIKNGRDIDTLPEAYQLPVAEFLAEREEGAE